MEKKLLTTVDGSVYSSNTIHYLAQLFQNADDVNIHLYSAIPSGPLPAGHELLAEQDLLNVITPETKKKHKNTSYFSDKARDQLIRKGVKPNKITSAVHLSRTSVAEDIVREARKGLYDTLVIGRRGLGKLEQLFMGSVSSTVLEKCHDIPIWIIDGQVNSRKFLVPVDGTPYTLRAVDHLCFMLKNLPDIEITLFHSNAIFTHKPTIEMHHFHNNWDQAWCQEHLSRPDSHFHGPEQLLIENGFSPRNIHRLETQLGMYPSRQIVRQAMLDNFGTIVMGRRPGEAKKDILGSVSGRVVAMAINTAIWIVG